jgi:hypothetical protein
MATDKGMTYDGPLVVIRDQARASNKGDHVRYAPIATEFRSEGK